MAAPSYQDYLKHQEAVQSAAQSAGLVYVPGKGYVQDPNIQSPSQQLTTLSTALGLSDKIPEGQTLNVPGIGTVTGTKKPETNLSGDIQSALSQGLIGKEGTAGSKYQTREELITDLLTKYAGSSNAPTPDQIATGVYSNPALRNASEGQFSGLDDASDFLSSLKGTKTVSPTASIRQQGYNAIAGLSDILNQRIKEQGGQLQGIGYKTGSIQDLAYQLGWNKDQTGSQNRVLINNLRGEISNLRAGAALTPTEIEQLDGYVPNVNDSPQKIQDKIFGLKIWLANRVKDAGGKVKDPGTGSGTPTGQSVDPAASAKQKYGLDY